MQELQLLSGRLDLLLKKYAAVQAENKKLKETISEQTRNIESLNARLNELETTVVAGHIGNGVLSDEEKVKMRKQLDNVLNEIDKILSSLND